MRNTLHSISILAAATVLAAAPAPASAQPDPMAPGDEPPVPESMPEPPPEPEPMPDPMPPPPPPETTMPVDTGVAAATDGPTGISAAGNYGVGVESTLAGLAGPAGRYQLSDQMALYGVLALSLTTVDGASSAYGLGAGVVYRLRSADTTAIGLVGGLDVSRATLGMADLTRFGVSAGVMAEWFIDPRIALYGKAGVGFAYATGDSTSVTNLLLGGETQTSFGAMYWFR